MMLLLRGQWKGLLPGLAVDAFAGTGKTTFFQLFGKLVGSTNEGEVMTYPVARAQLSGNPSGYVWLDDNDVNDHMQELLRQAVTEQKAKKMGLSATTGDWGTAGFQLRGSVIISGEGSELAKQKAIRDRFINLEFQVMPNPDAEKLKRENIERGSGALLVEVLKHAHMLPELESLREGVTSRDKQAQTTLRIGARILDAVLQTGTKYTKIIDDWYSGKTGEINQGNASVNVLTVFPRVWAALGEPTVAGFGTEVNAMWYNETEKCFYIQVPATAALWDGKLGRDKRDKSLTTPLAMKRELKACGAEGNVSARTKTNSMGNSKNATFHRLPKRYSDMILTELDHTPQGSDND
jgi:hypothetical protein